jgi:fibronectin-binding autotransporter adhesin
MDVLGRIPAIPADGLWRLHSSRIVRLLRPCVAALVIAEGFRESAEGQTLYYWSGSGANTGLTTAGNFKSTPTGATDATAISADATQLVFGTRTATATTGSNSTAGFNISGLIFSNSTSQTYSLVGQQIEFKTTAAFIEQNSSQTQNISVPVKLAERLTLRGDAAGLVNMTGAWEAGGKGITKSGSSSYFLNVASIASSGSVGINGGVLALQSGTALVGGVIGFNGGVLAAGGTFSRALGTGATNVVLSGSAGAGFAAYSTSGSNALTVSTALGTWGATSALANGAPLILGASIANNIVTLSGTLNLGTSGSTRTIRLVDNPNSANDRAVMSGVISGSANLQVTGTGLLVLSAANTYTGSTTITSGTLQLGSGSTTGSLSASSAISIAAGARFELNRSNTVTQGTDFSSAAISGSGGFTQAGSGTAVLTAANTYSGTTAITAGALRLGSGGTVGSLSSSSPIQIASGARLEVNRSNTVTQGTDFSSAAISGSGGFTQAGSGTTVLTAANTYSGTTAITAGALNIRNGSAMGAVGGAVTVASGAALELQGGITVGNKPLSLSGTGISGNGALRNISGTNTYGGPLTLSGPSAIRSDAGTLVFDVASGSAIAGGGFDLTFLGDGNVSVNDAVAIGTGNLIKSGTGVLTLGAANTFTGNTVINSGTVRLGAGGSLANSPVIDIKAGATLDVSLSGFIVSSSQQIKGTGSLSGAVTLNSLTSVLAPGSSPGIMDFEGNQVWGSFEYEWEVNDWAQAVAGENHDQIVIGGSLILNAANQYRLEVLSLTAGNASGPVPGFEEAPRSWTILTASGGISGFSDAGWTIDSSGFLTSLDPPTGSWSLAQSPDSNSLVLSYTPIPEPGSLILLVSGALLGLRRRRE